MSDDEIVDSHRRHDISHQSLTENAACRDSIAGNVDDIMSFI